jgi:hypothetical protein
VLPSASAAAAAAATGGAGEAGAAPSGSKVQEVGSSLRGICEVGCDASLQTYTPVIKLQEPDQ